MKSILKINLFLSVFFSMFVSNFTFASTITNIKGKQAVIDLEGAHATVGMQMYAIDKTGKKIGLLVIKQIKGTKALANIAKGTAMKGQSVITATLPQQTMPQKTNTQKPKVAPKNNETSADSGVTVRHSPWSAGGYVGYSFDTMALTAKGNGGSPQENVSLAGNSMSFKGFVYYDFNPTFTFRGAVGSEGFAGKGSASAANAAVCPPGGKCEVGFSYFSFEGHGQWNFYRTKTMKIWLSLGYEFLMASSSTTTINNLDTSSKTNSEILFGVGTDISSGKKGFIPLIFEYGYFPGSGDVAATSMYFRGGYGWHF